MAQTIVRTDDLDGSPDAEAVAFSFQGQSYTIDLADKNVKKLMTALKPFIDKATKTTTARGGPRTSSGAPKIDYSSVEYAGRPHRGRITDAEKRTVQNSLQTVNTNLRAAGVRELDINNTEHKEKYGI